MLVRNVFKHSHELESVDIEDQERVDRWLAEISVLVDDFRECRELFPVNRVSAYSPSGTTRATDDDLRCPVEVGTFDSKCENA